MKEHVATLFGGILKWSLFLVQRRCAFALSTMAFYNMHVSMYYVRSCSTHLVGLRSAQK
jgi:hypothetical protein